MFKFGIDTGAETNLIDVSKESSVIKSFKNQREDKLTGAGSIEKTIKIGEIKTLFIGKEKFENVTTVFSDISHLNNGYNLNIDGLIGFEVLSKQITLLSFKRRELVFVLQN